MADHPDDHAHSGEVVTSGAAVVRHVAQEVIRPLDVQQVKESMQLYQQGLHALLDRSDWQGPAGQTGSFVKKSGWRKIGAWFNLSTEPISEHVERGPQGEPLRARVWVRAIAPNGRAMAGDGACSREESRFAREGGRQKLENDLLATASTRATNRAISNLVGMGAVSAEEVGDDAAPSGPPFGPEGSAALRASTHAALGFMFDPEATDPDYALQLGESVIARVADKFGYFPHAVGWAVATAAKTLRDARDAADPDAQPGDDGPPPDPDPDPDPEDAPADAEVVSGDVVDPDTHDPQEGTDGID